MKARAKRIWTVLLEEFALFSFELVLILLLGVAAIAAFAKMANLLLTDRVKNFDDAISSTIFSWHSESMTTVMKTFTWLSNPQFVIFPFFIILIYFLFIKPHRWYSIKIPVVAIGSISMNTFLKFFFGRPRPVLEHLVQVGDLSFPSGHAMFSFSFYGLLIYIIWGYTKNRALRWTIATILLLTILMIGISRVYLRVHYPSDVLAGFAAGFLWLSISIGAIKAIEILIRKKEHHKAKLHHAKP